MSKSKATVFCFLDTNTLIEFKTFDEVDWAHVIGARVVIVIAPVVLTELDGQKRNHASSRRQKRARMLLPKLESLLTGASFETPASIRTHVGIFDETREPAIDWLGHGLNQSVADDRLIASVLALLERVPDVDVLVVSNDLGVRRKAQSRGLNALDPDGRVDRYAFPTSEEDVNRKLRAEVAALKDSRPDVRVEFHVDDGLTSELLVSEQTPAQLWQSDETIDKEVDLECRGCIRELGGNVRSPLFDQYKSEVKQYGEDLRLYLLQERTLNAGWRLTVRFALENAGGAPGRDIRARIWLPDGWTAAAEREFNRRRFGFGAHERPSRPRVPTPRELESKAWESVGITALGRDDPLRYLSAIGEASVQPEPELPNFGAIETTVWIDHPKLRAKDTWTTGQIVIFTPPLGPGSSRLETQVHLDEYSKPVDAELAIRVQMRD